MSKSLSFVLLLACSFLAATNVAHAYWDYDPALAYDLAYYSRVVSCRDKHIMNWTCGAACEPHAYNEGEAPHASTLTRLTVFRDFHYHTQGMAGYDATQNRIIVAFRDFDFPLNKEVSRVLPTLVPYTLCEADVQCVVMEEWFWRYNSKLSKYARETVSALVQEHPNVPIYVTGASAGGAFALFFALDFNEWRQGNPLKVMTFAQPRVGNSHFVNYAHSVLKNDNYIRVTKKHDEYVRAPSHLLGYQHLPHEIHYPSNSRHYISCHDSVGQESPNCANAGDDSPLSVHNEYLGVPLQC